MNQKLKDIGRWSLVLPSFIFGWILGLVIVAPFIFFELLMQLGYNTTFDSVGLSGLYYSVIYFIVSPLISGGLAIYCGAQVAPHHRNTTAVFLFALLLLLSIYIFTVYDPTIKYNIWWSLGSCVSKIVAGGYVMYQYLKRGGQFKFY